MIITTQKELDTFLKNDKEYQKYLKYEKDGNFVNFLLITQEPIKRMFIDTGINQYIYFYKNVLVSFNTVIDNIYEIPNIDTFNIFLQADAFNFIQSQANKLNNILSIIKG